MNKKAVFLGLFVDMLGWFIFFVGIVTWFFLFSFLSGDIVYEIESEKGYLSDNIIQTILETETENGQLSDEIILAINNQPLEGTEERIDQILNLVYGRANKVCWGIWYYKDNNQNTLYGVDCNKKNILFDQTINLLNPKTKKSEKIRLAILGYTK